MSISPITSNNSAIAATQFSGLTPVAATSKDCDGDNDGSRVSSASGRGGKFASAITQALAQLGVSAPSAGSTSGTSGASSAQDPKQALTSFMQNLFAALQSQNGTPAAASSGSASGTSASGAGANTSVDGTTTGAAAATTGHGHHHHGGGGMSKLESGLQSLSQQLSSSSGQTTSGGPSNPSLDALQQSFNNLLSADGASGSNATLNAFLQSLSQSLHGAPTTGNVVTTKA